MEHIAHGITFQSTPGHGYYILSVERLAEMEERAPSLVTKTSFYNGGNSFEEDLEWARVALAFPEFFSIQSIKYAIEAMRNSHPDIYESFTGRKIPLRLSYRKRQRIFLEKHKNDYVVVADVGSWHDDCPEGFVLVTAVRGGRLENGHYASNDFADFFVPVKEYRDRNEFSFVIDESKHTRK